MLRYLSTAEIESDGRIRWGILTSGDVWRLYYGRARPRATGYFEADLGDVLERDDDALRVFYLLFRRDSFTLRDGAVTTFLESALAEGRRYEEKVAADLSGTVFERVFPRLVGALAGTSGEDLSAVREAALIFLYRLLFILYAEDRGLLPVNDPRYDDYGLRKPVREDIARRMERGAAFSTVASSYYDHLTTLCRLIDVGDPSIGLPPYNGGLFSESAAPMLGRVRLPDATVAPLIYDLSHAEGEAASTGSREPGSTSRPAGSLATGTCRCSSSVRSTSGCWSGSRFDKLTGARFDRLTGPGARRRDRGAPEPLRAQGQRQLLHAAGAG